MAAALECISRRLVRGAGADCTDGVFGRADRPVGTKELVIKSLHIPNRSRAACGAKQT